MKKRYFILSGVLLIALIACIFVCVKKNSSASGEKKAESELSIEVLNVADNGVKMEDFAKSSFSLVTGAIQEKLCDKHFPKANKKYFNTGVDCLKNVAMGKVDATILPNTMALECKEYDNVRVLKKKMNPVGVAAAVSNTTTGKKLKQEFNSFIAEYKNSTEYDKLVKRYLYADMDVKVEPVDLAKLEGKNGSIRMSISGDNPPYMYLENNKYAGIDAIVMYRFAEKYGYSIDVYDSNLPGVLASISTGKTDMGFACMAVTEERKEVVDFTDNYTEAYSVVVYNLDIAREKGFVRKKDKEDALQLEGVLNNGVTALDYKNRHFAIITGGFQDELLKKMYPNAECDYYKSTADCIAAVSMGKCDASIVTYFQARQALPDYDNLAILPKNLLPIDMGFIFGKTQKGKALLDEFNQFYNSFKESKEGKALYDYWIESRNHDNAKVCDFESLKGKKGKLRLCCSGVKEPFNYIKDNKLTGYESCLVYEFCKRNGYRAEIEMVDFDSLILNITTGKSDIAFDSLVRTKEREQKVYFSDQICAMPTVIVYNVDKAKEYGYVRQNDTMEGVAKKSFFYELKESFIKTFIKENRWKPLLEGLGITMLITVLSCVFGTLLGFVLSIVSLMKSKLGKVLKKIVAWYVNIFEGTPILVILLVLYYVIFGDSDLEPGIVAIIAFSLNLAAFVSESMRAGILAIDKGQREAALALGFSEKQSFFKVIFPQAARHFLPVYRGNIITMFKGTSVVGFIAIQDLTKAGDIIRSRTYEALFPLLSVAIIYFLISYVITLILKAVEKRIDPEKKALNQ